VLAPSKQHTANLPGAILARVAQWSRISKTVWSLCTIPSSKQINISDALLFKEYHPHAFGDLNVCAAS